MKATSRRPVGLLAAAAIYLVVTLAPLFVILVGPVAPQRGFWVEFAVAMGFIGLAMLGLQSILTARFPRVSSAVGQDTLLQFHRQAGLVAFVFILSHPVILVLANGDYWSFLDPRVNLLRAVFLLFVVVALPTLIVTSLWREGLRLPYQWWRLGHGVLAMLILVVGLVHITRVHYYLRNPWKQALWVAIGTAAIASVLYVRAIKPLRVRRRPYRVVGVAPAAARIWTVTLAPETEPALRFRAGQFAFVTIDDSPYSLEQHPFTIASSAEHSDCLQFTIKELGDFTNDIAAIPIGQRAYLDGPYGSVHLPFESDSGLFVIAGGIGITPIISMLRTLGDQHSSLPVVLIYANNRVDDTAFAEELDALTGLLNLRVIHVLTEPPASWAEEVGFVTPDLIARHLPDEPRERWRYILCGPPPMMEVAEHSLVDLGVPLDRIDSERFNIGAAGAIGRRSIQVRRLVVVLGAVMVGAAALFAA